MLESFTDYLRASLTHLRQAEASLNSELDLADAYLRLLQLRMEDRLQFAIEADPQARSALLPPLMLQPLVENAIHHGLEPKLDGGSLTIRAQVSEGVLQVMVSDDGLGPDAPKRRGTGNGIALDNLRQRLQALYGSDASLTIEPLQPGTRATLRLPFTDTAATP
jgi:sensor histidine kinase YesM